MNVAEAPSGTSDVPLDDSASPWNVSNRLTAQRAECPTRVLVNTGNNNINPMCMKDDSIARSLVPKVASIAQTPPVHTREITTGGVLDYADVSIEACGGALVISGSLVVKPQASLRVKEASVARCKKRKWNAEAAQPLRTGLTDTEQAHAAALEQPSDAVTAQHGPPLPLANPQLAPPHIDNAQPQAPNENNPGGGPNTVHGNYHFESTTDIQRKSYIPLVIIDGHLVGRINITKFKNIPIHAWSFERGFEFVVNDSRDEPVEDIFYYASGVISLPHLIDQNTFYCYLNGDYMYFQVQYVGNNPGDGPNMNHAAGNARYYLRQTVDYKRFSRIPLAIINGHYQGSINITGFLNVPIHTHPSIAGFEFDVIRSIENPGEEIFHYASGIITFPHLVDHNTHRFWIDGNKKQMYFNDIRNDEEAAYMHYLGEVVILPLKS